MQIINNVQELKKIRQSLNQKVAFVPTMGALHSGHLELVKKAKKNADFIIVSIFVNPTQFAKNEDLDKYPNTLSDDIEHLKKLEVDVLFNPNKNDIYPERYETTVKTGALAKKLCGSSRPTHFDGVATVVLKLFNLVKPNIAVFGKKDYQQLKIIERMVKDFSLDIDIIGQEIIREDSGLAMSSRNKYLNPSQKQKAASIYQALKSCKETITLKTTTHIKQIFMEHLDPTLELEFIEVCDRQQLNHIDEVIKDNSVILVAVKSGTTRLIDNIEL